MIHKSQLTVRLVSLFVLLAPICIAASGGNGRSTTGSSSTIANIALSVVIFGGIVLVLNWAWQPITITLDKAADRLSIRYGGVFGLGARTHELALGDVQGATEHWIVGRGSRMEFILTSGKRLPLTGSYSFAPDEARDIATLVNTFVHPKRPRHHKELPEGDRQST